MRSVANYKRCSRTSFSSLSGRCARTALESEGIRWQGKRIGPKPLNPLIMRLNCRGTIEHWLVEIGRNNARFSRKPRCDGSRERASSRGRFQYLSRFNGSQSFGQIAWEPESHRRSQGPTRRRVCQPPPWCCSSLLAPSTTSWRNSSQDTMLVCPDCAGTILADPTRDHLGRASSFAKPGHQ